jgi:RNA polymerase sigma-70 factor (ECF subfamily)
LEQAQVWTDADVVQRVLAGDIAAFELLMRRHNQRVYRAIRAILRDDSETEDVMQETYVRAYEHLAQFEGRAQFSTWITRIAVNEAIKRAAARRKLDPLDEGFAAGEEQVMPAFQHSTATPETNASQNELKSILEQAVLALPDGYRAVVMLRDIEDMSTADAAEVLSLTEANVKVRLHRAHAMLRDELLNMTRTASPQAFGFHATRCDRVVAAVMERIGATAETDAEKRRTRSPQQRISPPRAQLLQDS